VTSFSRSFAASSALLLLLAGCGPKDGVKEYKAGQAAYEARSLEKAEGQFRKCLEYAPGNVDALVMLARTQCDLGWMVEASETIARAVELEPEAPDVVLLDAEIAFYLNDYARAVKRFRDVAGDASAGAEAQSLGWTGIGIVEMTCDKRDYARIAFLVAIRFDHRNASARYHLGLLYRGDSYGYLDAALEQFEIFVRLGDRTGPRAEHVQRVIIPGIKDDISRRAVERCGGRRNAEESARRLAAAEAAWKEKKFEKARAEYEAAVKEDLLSYPAVMGLAKALEKTDTSAKGRQRVLDCYKAACALRPTSVSTLLKTGDLAARMDQNATAAEVYSRAVAANPSNITAVDGLIRSLRKTGNAKVAAAYQRYRETIPVRKAK